MRNETAPHSAGALVEGHRLEYEGHTIEVSPEDADGFCTVRVSVDGKPEEGWGNAWRVAFELEGSRLHELFGRDVRRFDSRKDMLRYLPDSFRPFADGEETVTNPYVWPMDNEEEGNVRTT